MSADCQKICQVVDQIVAIAKPQQVILFSRKLSLLGETSSFKLCVIAHCPAHRELENQLYLQVDSEIPFDLVVYTPDQWAQQLLVEGSFASQIRESGEVLYG